MRVLLIEPWYGGSHRAWADGLVRHSRHDIALVTHDDSFWRWRLRGSALTLAALVDDEVERNGPPDAVVVSGLTDLAQLLGHTRRSLAGVPVALYLHESQLLHPHSPNGDHDPQHAWANWSSMAAADRVAVNSRHHFDALRTELPAMLSSVPDHAHTAQLDAVLDRTRVLPVGVELDELLALDRDDDRVDPAGPLIVWNQRWDHDKDPDALFRVLVALARNGVAFRLALAGENRRVDPREFDAVHEALGDRLVHRGFLPRADYVALLLEGDVVVSTARHEFFGIAVVEAMAAGLVPLLPDRLSYPELVPKKWHDQCLYRARLYEHLERVLVDLPAARARVCGLRTSMARFAWPQVIGGYDDLVDELVGQSSSAEQARSTSGS